MNERIKELMAQAGFDPAAIERMGVMPQSEKFAELIIKECASFREELSQFDSSTAYGDGYEQGLNDLTETFLEHFGFA